VIEDVQEGMISREAARTLYGVVLDDDLRIDLDASKALRREMRTRR
jgi:N-methylhydantoinase B/oxoprolinase/acetone carboxylase alpha subunit